MRLALRPTTPRLLVALLALAMASTLLPGATGVARAAVDLPGIAIDDPADYTPHIPTGGTIRGMAEVGNTVVVGGSFGAINKDGVRERSNIAAFDSSTGVVLDTFAPTLNGDVYDVVAVPGEDAVVVAGFFTEVNGQERRYLVKLTMDGQIDPTFTSQADRPVYAAVIAGDTVYAGGNFRVIGNQARNRLAAFDASTGAVVDDFRFSVEQPRVTFNNNDPNQGVDDNGFLHVFDLDVSDDGSRVVVIGNFTKVADVDTNNAQGPQLDRTQVMVIDNAASPPRIDADWRTRRYEPNCVITRYSMYVRDVEVAPDASYFVVTTAGYWGQGDSTCDTAARFDLFRDGQDIQPTWLSYSGGDSLLQSHIQDDVVYIGGHPRYANNPFGRDGAGPGHVDRLVAYAVDDRNGIPLTWDPTIEVRDPNNPRRRGYGIESFLATDEGLYIGSDMRFANDEYHNKIMLFPTGDPAPRPVPASLPATARVVRDDGTVELIDFDGTTATPQGATTADPRVDWTEVRSSWRMGERLYTFTSQNRLYRYDDGGGGRIRVDLLGLETTNSYTSNDGRRHTRFETDQLRGAAYDNVRGRLYFTVRNDNRLYWRGFTAESDIVGALLHTASSANEFDFDQVDGMFLSGDHLYLARPNGDLDRITMDEGLPVSGSTVTLSGPGTDGVDWSGRTLHLQSDASTVAPNVDPTAGFTATCDAATTCTLDASESFDTDGTIDSYEWFVDQAPVGTGRVLEHTLPQEGSYQVRLLVTDDRGGVGSATQTVEVTADPVAAFTVSCDQLTCNFDATSSSDGPDGVVSADWDFGDTTTDSGLTVSHTFPSEGNFDVTVIVTDDEGQTGTATQTVTVTEPAGAIAFRSVANSNIWSPNPTVTIPADVLAGDTLLLYASVADPDMLAGAPTNGDWTLLGSRSVSRHESHVWWRVAREGDAGTDVTVPLTAGRKTDLTLAVYEDANPTAPVATFGGEAETVSRADHTTPTVATATDTLVVSFWAQKASNTTDWTAPAGQQVRSEVFGVGGGQISTLLTDAGSVAAPGQVGGLTATADVPALTATQWTVALSKTDTSDAVSFTGTDSQNIWTASPTVTVPNSVSPGDLLLLVASVSWLEVTPDQPTGVTGWTRLEQAGDGVQTTIWWKEAQVGDPGSDVTVPLDRGKKVDLSIVGYANVDTVAPFVAQQHVLEDTVRGDHTTPALTTAEPGLVVSYWADKSEATTDWVEPAGQTLRVESTGVGGGRVGVLITDGGLVEGAGAVGGLTATADSANDSGLQWTLVLRPA